MILKGVKLIVLIGILLSCSTAFGQEQEAKFSSLPLKDRIYLGGNLALQLGNRLTFIEVSPLVGLWLNPKLVAGAGPVYRYFRRSDLNFEDNQYGARLFSRYHFVENLFGHAEYEWLNLTDYRILPDSPRTNINSVLVGGGYLQGFGRSGLFIMVLFNLTETELSPYDNPIIRAGFNIGL